MTERLTEEDGRALVTALVAGSPYKDALTPMLDDIVRIALANDQIRSVLVDFLESNGLPMSETLTQEDLGSYASTLNDFLEYIYFASPSFLNSVGEGPTGD